MVRLIKWQTALYLLFSKSVIGVFGFLKTSFGCTNTKDQLSKQSTQKLLSKHQKYPDTPKPPACGADGYNLGSWYMWEKTGWTISSETRDKQGRGTNSTVYCFNCLLLPDLRKETDVRILNCLYKQRQTEWNHMSKGFGVTWHTLVLKTAGVNNTEGGSAELG